MATEKVVTFHEVTAVHMAELENEEIEAYVATGDPLDKAGSYGIQSTGGCLVSGIEGDYNNVVGFPLHRFCKRMSELKKEIFGV